MTNSESQDKSFADNKIRKTFEMPEYLAKRIELSSKAQGASETDIICQWLLFGSEYQSSRIRKNQKFDLAVTSEKVPCIKCGEEIPEFTEALFNTSRGFLCMNCDPTLGSPLLAKRQRVLHKLEDLILRNKTELKEIEQRVERYENQETIHELLVKAKSLLQIAEDIFKRQICSFFDNFSKYNEAEARKEFDKLIENVRAFNRAMETLALSIKMLQMTASDWVKRVKPRKIVEQTY